MRLEQLQIRHFRNITEACLTFGPRMNLITGCNGQGKSNLLEAIGLLATGRSFRRAPAEIMRQQGQPSFLLTGRTLHQGVSHRLEFMGQGNRQSVRLDHKPLASLSSMDRLLAAVVCTPDTLHLVRGSPAERRNYIDWVAFITDRSHATLVRNYQTALRARNQLLQQDRGDGHEFDAWEEPLADLGARISVQRRRVAHQLDGHLAWLLRALLSMPHTFRVAMLGELERQPAVSLELDAVRELYRTLLRNSRQRDRRAGGTTVGPHREEVLLQFDGGLLAHFGSQGEQKRFILALKMAEALLLEQVTGLPPLFLLDDPVAELDREGVALLMQFLAGRGNQLFLATCNGEEILWPGPDPCVFTVTSGTFVDGSVDVVA